MWIFAKIRDDATRAEGLAREAYVASVQEEPMVRVLPIRRRSRREQAFFDLQRRLARRKPGAIGDPEYVGVDADRQLAKYDVQNNVRRLAPDSWECLEGRPVRGDLSSMKLEKLAA